MIEYQLNIVGSLSEIATTRFEINFRGAAIKEAIDNNLFYEFGTQDNPFNLDSFVKWSEDITGIKAISQNREVKIQYYSTPELQSVQLLTGYLTHRSPQNSPLINISDWEKYFSWSNFLRGYVTILRPNTASFNLKNLVENVRTELFSTNEQFPVPNTFFSFGFNFSFKVPGNSTTFYGKVDPLLKVSTGGGTPTTSSDKT